jgi:hypothetical protein
MAQIVLTDVIVSIANFTIVANGVKSVTINDNPEMKDNTGMGMTAKSRKRGLDDWSLDIEIFQDYLDDQLDEDIWTAFKAGTTVGAIAIQPVTGTVSPNLPSYRSTAGMVESYSPIAAGAVGDLAIAKLKIVAMGTELTRAVSP